MTSYSILKKSMVLMAVLPLFSIVSAYASMDSSSLIARGEERERALEHRPMQGTYGHGAYGGAYHPEARAAARGYEAGQGVGAGAAGGYVDPGYVAPPSSGQNINVQTGGSQQGQGVAPQ